MRFCRPTPKQPLFCSTTHGLQFQNQPGSYVVAAIQSDVAGVLAELQEKYPASWASLQRVFLRSPRNNGWRPAWSLS